MDRQIVIRSSIFRSEKDVCSLSIIGKKKIYKLQQGPKQTFRESSILNYLVLNFAGSPVYEINALTTLKKLDTSKDNLVYRKQLNIRLLCGLDYCKPTP